MTKVYAVRGWGYGAKYHLFEGPDRTSGPFDPFWSVRGYQVGCRRFINGSATSTAYSDGSALPLCKLCERQLGLPA